MKKILLLLLLILVNVTVIGCSRKDTLVLYLPGEYIDNSNIDGENLVKQFEQEYNCNVKMINFNSNEIAISMMETNSFDLVIPSDYAIEKLVADGRLLEIDWSKVMGFTKNDISEPLIEIFDYLENGDNPFDMLKYMVPYFWGSVGICYNKANVSIEELDMLGWDIFLQSKYKNRVAYYDSQRDGYIPPLKALGYSLNTKDKEEVKKATQWLRTMKKNVNPKFKTDELLSELPDMRYDLALIYSGDALYSIELAAENGGDLGFYLPKQGTNFFCDGMVIPKNSKNIDLAYSFISYICEAENALANTSYVGYTSSVNEAFQIAVSDSEYYGDFSDIYSPLFKDVDQFFRFDEEMRYYFSDEWCKFIA